MGTLWGMEVDAEALYGAIRDLMAGPVAQSGIV